MKIKLLIAGLTFALLSTSAMARPNSTTKSLCNQLHGIISTNEPQDVGGGMIQESATVSLSGDWCVLSKNMTFEYPNLDPEMMQSRRWKNIMSEGLKEDNQDAYADMRDNLIDYPDVKIRVLIKYRLTSDGNETYVIVKEDM